MITDCKELVSTCKKQMEEMGYAFRYSGLIYSKLDLLVVWANREGQQEYSPDIGERFLNCKLGSHYHDRCLTYDEASAVIAINKINALQATGKALSVRKVRILDFPESYSFLLGGYRKMLEVEKCNKQSTIDKKLVIIRDFLKFLWKRQTTLSELKKENVLAYMMDKGCTDVYRYYSSNVIRELVDYAARTGFCKTDIIEQVPHFTSRVVRRLPTVFTHDEIRALLASFDRSSALGKRDYLMALLAAAYGWRAADILSFAMASIDWEKNEIGFDQQKSGNHVVYPLLPEVGNAIIDYMRNGRPKTDEKSIIVAHVSGYKGHAMGVANLNAVITAHMKKAGICDWEKRNHGPHALRHSIATNMLGDNVSLPIIQQVLGHKNPESTQVYLSVDIRGLRKCTFPVPGFCNHPVYGGMR